jgi:Flp pilus assembly protein TadG
VRESLRPSRWRTRDDRGAVAVELALVLPIFFLLVLGIIQYGMYFYARQGGADVARDAARQAAVGAPAKCAPFKADLTSKINGFGGTGSSATITRKYTKTDTTTTDIVPGDYVTVRVAFNSFDMHVPMLPFVNNGRVDTTVKARVEYVPTQPETCS